MSFTFDHFVHVVNNPEKAIEKFTTLGLHVARGGRHENLGTYNTLSYFGLSYIEFIDVFDQQLASEAAKEEHGLVQSIVENKGEGPVRIALRSKDLDTDAEHFQSLGYEVNGPTDFSRTRPDGSKVEWKLLFVGKPGQSPELPFFIQWNEPDEEREQELKENGVIVNHPAGEISIDSVGIAVKNANETAKQWSELLQLEQGSPITDEILHARGYPLHMPGGNIIFYEPTGNGAVQSFLQEKGEKPFMLQFTGAEKEDVPFLGALYRFNG